MRTFVRERQKNWRVVHANFALLQRQYENYLSDFSRCGKYRSLKPNRYAAHAVTLSRLYDQDPKCLAHIKQFRVRTSKTLAVCPYCGLPAGKLTLDHYLPRNKRAFPHLSVFSFNLVPACTACQEKKSSTTPVFRLPVSRVKRKTAAQKRLSKKRRRAKKAESFTKKRYARIRQHRHVDRFLHPYFDHFLSNIVWKLTPRDQSRPLTSLALVPAVRRVEEAALVGYHIRNLGIQKRARPHVGHLVRFSAEKFRIGNVKTRDEAKLEAQALLSSALRKEKTPNGFDSTFFRALRDQAALTDAVVRIARRAPPMRIIKSQGVHI